MYFVASNDFETCAQDLDCAKQCVKAYQLKNQKPCLLSKQTLQADAELTCADYGRIHFSGPKACASPDSPETVKYLKNLTRFCGCASM